MIVKGGSIFAIGINKDRNHPNIVTPGRAPVDCAIHAEIDALRRAGNVRGATMYNARVNKQGEPRMSKPCDNCQAAIDEAGIKRIVWTE